jgi:hypothetical protein
MNCDAHILEILMDYPESIIGDCYSFLHVFLLSKQVTSGIISHHREGLTSMLMAYGIG